MQKENEKEVGPAFPSIDGNKRAGDGASATRAFASHNSKNGNCVLYLSQFSTAESSLKKLEAHQDLPYEIRKKLNNIIMQVHDARLEYEESLRASR